MVFGMFLSKNNVGKIKSFHLFEIYKDSKALDFHRNTTHYKNYRSKIIDLLSLLIICDLLLDGT